MENDKLCYTETPTNSLVGSATLELEGHQRMFVAKMTQEVEGPPMNGLFTTEELLEELENRTGGIRPEIVDKAKLKRKYEQHREHYYESEDPAFERHLAVRLPFSRRQRDATPPNYRANATRVTSPAPLEHTPSRSLFEDVDDISDFDNNEQHEQEEEINERHQQQQHQPSHEQTEQENSQTISSGLQSTPNPTYEQENTQSARTKGFKGKDKVYPQEDAEDLESLQDRVRRSTRNVLQTRR